MYIHFIYKLDFVLERCRWSLSQYSPGKDALSKTALTFTVHTKVNRIKI